MKKSFRKIHLLTVLVALLAVAFCFSAGAAQERYQEGYLFYTVTDGEATIVGGKDFPDGEVVIPGSIGGYPVTAIGKEAFSWNRDIVNVIIGEGVKTIGDGAFENSTVETIVLPASLTDVGEHPFQWCSKLKSITVNEDSETYSNDENGVLFNKDKTVLVRYPQGNERTSYGIPDTVRTIHSRAFLDSYYLTSVIITDSVTAIDEFAFYSCGKLESVVISEGVTTIERDAFMLCSKLNSVTIPVGVTSIENGAFFMCYDLRDVTIPDTVKSIGNSAFSSCDLISITIPSSVESIGGSAFEGNPLTEVIISEGVKSIGPSAFEWCVDLRSVKIPNSVTEIGWYAFGYCIEDLGEFEETIIEKIDGFTITAGECSAAHRYADTYGLNFIDDGSKKHSFTTVLKKATFEKAGSKVSTCECGETKTETYPAVTSATLSTEKYVYNGKNRTPKVTVKDSEGNVLTKNVDYKLTVASKRSGIGRYTVKVTLIGNYEGTKNVFFYILPGVTSEVKASAQTSSSVKLSWEAVDGAKGYKIYRYSPSKKAYVSAGTTEKTYITVPKLLAGTKYTFRVVSYGETAAGKPYDSAKYALIKTATCTKTPELTKVTSSSGKARLYWSAVSGETGYTVYYSTKKDSGFKKYANYKADSTNGYAEDLTVGKTYYFKVRTYIKTDSGYVYSSWSDVKSVKITTEYYVTKTGTKYHVDGCSSLSRSKIKINYGDAISKGYKPCDKCIK